MKKLLQSEWIKFWLCLTVALPLGFYLIRCILWFFAKFTSSGLSSLSLSDIGVWCGSIGTVGSLFFLIIQNRQLTQNKKKTDERNEQIYREQQAFNQKQSELWATQLKNLQLETYQRHVNHFNDVLDRIEASKDKRIRFTDRNWLYLSLFPNNNSGYCETVIQSGENKTLSKAMHTLASAFEIYGVFHRQDEGWFGAVKDTLYKFDDLNRQLRLEFTGEPRFGDVSKLNKRTGYNVIKKGDSLLDYMDILIQLESLTGSNFSDIKQRFRYVPAGDYLTNRISDYEPETFRYHGYQVFYDQFDTFITIRKVYLTANKIFHELLEKVSESEVEFEDINVEFDKFYLYYNNISFFSNNKSNDNLFVNQHCWLKTALNIMLKNAPAENIAKEIVQLKSDLFHSVIKLPDTNKRRMQKLFCPQDNDKKQILQAKKREKETCQASK